MEAQQLSGAQYALSRRAFDVMGVVSAPGDSFFRFNAKSQFNLAYFGLYRLISISGDVVTLGKLEPEQNLREMTFSFWRQKEEQWNMFWLNGFASYTSPAPGDILTFGQPSRGQHLKAKVIKINSCSNDELEIKVDKACSVAMQMYPVEEPEINPPNPEYVTCALWHYGKEHEKWQYIREPNFFMGVRVQRVIQKADIPQDGLYQLDPGPIATPKSFDPLRPNFILEGLVGINWQPINENHRLYIHHDLGSHYAFRTTLPEGSVRDALTTSLPDNPDYTAFRVTYYRKATETDTNCELTGFASCDMAREDISGSVQNYNAGEGTDGNHYCAKRRYYDYERKDLHNRWPENGQPTDGIDDTIVVHHLKPKGLPQFKRSCQLFGYCNKWEDSIDAPGKIHIDAPHLSPKDAPFITDMTIAPVVDEMIFAPDLRGEDVSFPYFGALQNLSLHRLYHPSILGLTGYYGPAEGGLQSKHGWHPKHRFRGLALFGKPDKDYVDVNGNKHLQNVTGLEYGYTGYDLDPERPGRLPELTPNFKDHRHVIDVTATVTEDLLETVGSVVERDSGAMPHGRHLNRISFALPPWDVLCPAIDLEVTDKQLRTHANFERGLDGIGHIDILPLRQEAKGEQSLGHRTIAKVTPLGGIKYRLEFDNEDQLWSEINTGSEQDNFDSFDEVFSVKSGGIFPILPPEPRMIDSYNNQWKYAGSRRAGAQPGDAIRITDKMYLIDSVEAFAGTEETSYGNRKQVVEITLGGGWAPAGVTQDRLPIEIIEVKNGDNDIIKVYSDEFKPDLLINEAWWDEKTLALWPSSLNDGETFYIRWKTSEKDATEQTSQFTVDQYIFVSIDKDIATWTDATERNIYIGALALTEVTEDPVKDQFSIDYGELKIKYTFNIDNAPHIARVVLLYNEPAPAPRNDWSFDNQYLSYARKRDVAVIYCEEPQWIPPVGASVEFLRSAGAFVAQENLVLEWTRFGTDQWFPVGSDNYTVNHGSGRISIAPQWFAEHFSEPVDPENPESLETIKGVICFRAKQVQLMDHRGHVPASLYNKLFRMIDSEQMQWAWTWMGTGFGEYSIDQGVYQSYDAGNSTWKVPNGPCISGSDSEIDYGPAGGQPNYFYMDSVDDTSSVSLRVSASSFGIPEYVANIPDGAEIMEAWAEVSSATLTRSHVLQTNDLIDCEFNVIETGINPEGEPDVTVGSPTFTVIAFSSKTTFSVLGTISADKDGQTIVNITPLIKKMHENRNNPDKNYGYGVIYSPVPFNEAAGAGLEQFLKKGPTRPEPVCVANECYDVGDSVNRFFQHEYLTMRWGNINFGRIAVRVDYKGTDRLPHMIAPRYPSFSTVDVPTERPTP